MGFDGNLKPPDAVADPDDLEDEFGPGPRFESRANDADDDDDDDGVLDVDDVDDEPSIVPVDFEDDELDEDPIPAGAGESMASGEAAPD